ncbi:MAG: hypothetical protein ACXAB4_12305 [Candidatus Hodarchaeales archaeon]|jgi:hypothetical protein
MPEESNDDKIKTAYAKLGSRMKGRLQSSKERAQETRVAGLEKLEKEKTPSFLPDGLVFRILGLKRQTSLPETLLPSSHFEKKGRKSSFLRRLAADVLEFGRAYQRAYSTLPTSEEVVSAFMKERDYWECDEKDVFDAIKGLHDGGLIGIENANLVFESLSLSRDIASLLKEVWQLKKEFWTPTELASTLRWGEAKVHETLRTLANERICTRDDEGYWFTGFSS